jgi:hypothetical protein
MKSRNPDRFCHVYLKSNPENIKLVEYRNDSRPKRIVLFPEGRILQYEDRLDLTASLLVTLLKTYRCDNPITSDATCARKLSSRRKLFPRELVKLVEEKARRYEKWLKKK